MSTEHCYHKVSFYVLVESQVHTCFPQIDQEIINKAARKITCLVRLVKIGKDEDLDENMA